MRGTKPTPTALKLLRDNPGQRRLNTQEPELPPLDPSVEEETPLELQGDPIASAEWLRLMPMLRHARQITEAERGLLIALCQQWSRYQVANKKVDTLGLVITMPTSGYPMPNPFLGVANRALMHCTRLWAELGLTPSSRSRVMTAGASATTAAPSSRHQRLFGTK